MPTPEQLIQQYRAESATYRVQADLYREAAEHLTAYNWLGTDVLASMTEEERQEWLRDQINHYTPIGFNQFVRIAAKRGVAINYCRERFHAFVVSTNGSTDGLRTSDWWTLWEMFDRLQDARDERDTRNDARYAGVPA